MFKHVFTAFVGAAFISSASVDAQDRSSGAQAGTPALRSEVRELQAALPLSFEANRGQTDPRVKFVARAPGYDLFLTAGAAILSQHGGVPLTITLVGASKTPDVNGLGQLPGKTNYFIGGDRRKWHAGVPLFRQVRFSGVYPGIDLVYYGKQRELEYDFHVAPGSDPRRIRLRFGGADRIGIDGNGDLVLHTASGEVRQRKPLLYQDIDGVRRTVAGRYTMRGPWDVGFDVAAYDKSKPLVIDPVLMYSSYLGGGGWDFATAVAVDAAGHVYVTGWTDPVGFPTKNTIQPGTRFMDVFVTKIDPSTPGEPSIVYSTYLGGLDSDEARAIAVDAGGNVYITGWTLSFDRAGTLQNEAFPVTADAFQRVLYFPPVGHTMDVFLTKLNAEGNGLVYSTYLGGNHHDVAEGIAVDAAGHAYLTGWTESIEANPRQPHDAFPTTPGAFQPTNPRAPNGGDASVFVVKFDLSQAGNGSLAYSTHLGGTGGERGSSIAVDANGEPLVAGWTTSLDFPMMNAVQPQSSGGTSGFVAKLSADLTALRYATYLGDDVADLAVDAVGHAYVTGRARTGLPTRPDAFQPLPVGVVAASFVAKLDLARAGDASLVYATFLGAGGHFDGAHAIAVDSTGHAYIAGTTSGPFPTTPDAVSGSHSGNGDAFVAKLNATGTALLYSTYLGGSDTDVGRGIAVDADGNMYLAGETGSTNFPVVSAYQPAYGGSLRDAFVSVIGRPTFTISGEVLDRTTSEPVSGVTIALSGSRVATAVTGATGFYSFSLPTEATYTVTPSRTGYTFVPASRTFASFSGNEFGDFTAIADGAPDPDPDPDPGDEIELPPGSRIKIGDIEVNAGRIVQLSGRPNSGTEVTEDGVYRLSESVNFNFLLFFEGEIEVTLDKALKKLAVEIKSGHIYAADMPPFGKMTLWRGAGIKFDVDGIASKINDLIKVGLERMPLKVAGANVEMKSIKLFFGDDPGVEITGTLTFPTIAGLAPLSATVDSLLISRKLGLRFGGQIKVEKLEVGGGFKVNKVLLKYTPNYTNPARDVFVGEGDLTTPAFRVIGKVKFVGGALDSVGAAIKDLKVEPSITPATPVLTITGGELGIGGFREPPFFALLSVDLSVGPAELKKVLALKGATIKYTYPSKIEGSTELTLFTVKIAKAFLGLDVAKPTIDIQTQVVLIDGLEIFIVTADLSAGRKTLESGESVFYIAGGAKGVVQFPAQAIVDGKPYTGFPFDLLKGLGVTLPFQIASAEVSYRDDEFKAAVTFPIIDTVALSVKNVQKLLPPDLQKQLDAAIQKTKELLSDITSLQELVARARAEIYDGINLESNEAQKRAAEASLSILLSEKATLDRQVAALRAASMAPQARIATNFFLLPSEIILGAQTVAPGPMNVSYRSAFRTAAAQIIGTVTVPANAPKLITRLSSGQAAPRYSLVAPDGSIVGPESGAATFVVNAESKVSYFVVNNPAPGRWVVSPDPDAQGPFTFDAIGANRPPVIDHVSAVGTADRVEVAYSVADVDDAATVSLFYDTNRDGFNGHLIAQGLSESVNGTYIWNPALDRVPSGEYYVYAIVEDGANAPARRYSDGRITIVDPRAPATPGNVNAAGGGENSLRVTWAAVPGATGYNLRYSTTAADGQTVTSVADTGAQTEMLLPKLASDALYRVSVQAYAVFEVPDAFSPTGQRTDVAMGVPSAEVTALTGTAEAPLVRLISPNGGETIPANTTLNIMWDVAKGNDLRDQQIELSTDGGATYHPLALRLAPDVRSFEWDVPLVLHSTTTRLRVSALDRAGNESIDASDADFSINGTASTPESKIDSVAPSIAGALSEPANAAGWHRGAVTVSLEATDADSGVKAITYSAHGSTIIPVTTAPGASLSVPLTADGTTTISYVAADNAGNLSEVKTIDVKIDRTPPTIEIASPVQGVPLLLNLAVSARYTCADAGAGLEACAGSVPDGAAIDTSVPRTGQFVVNAADRAGNTATTTVRYSVAYGVRLLYDESKAHKSGSTVPLKVQLIDATGRNLSSALVVVSAIGVVRVSEKVSDALAEPSNEAAGTDFKYDAGSEGYHYNFKTTGLTSGRYVVVFRVGADSSTYQAPFQIR